MDKKDYFPLVIKYTDTNEYYFVEKPEDIESGRAFKVIEVSCI